MLIGSVPGSASLSRTKYLATLVNSAQCGFIYGGRGINWLMLAWSPSPTKRGFFDRSTGTLALEALSQMKFENGIPLMHYNRGPEEAFLPSLWLIVPLGSTLELVRWAFGQVHACAQL